MSFSPPTTKFFPVEQASVWLEKFIFTLALLFLQPFYCALSTWLNMRKGFTWGTSWCEEQCKSGLGVWKLPESFFYLIKKLTLCQGNKVTGWNFFPKHITLPFGFRKLRAGWISFKEWDRSVLHLRILEDGKTVSMCRDLKITTDILKTLSKPQQELPIK